MRTSMEVGVGMSRCVEEDALAEASFEGTLGDEVEEEFVWPSKPTGDTFNMATGAVGVLEAFGPEADGVPLAGAGDRCSAFKARVLATT